MPQLPLPTYLSQTCCGDLTDSIFVLLLISALLLSLSLFYLLVLLHINIFTGRFCRTTRFIYQLACLGHLYFTVASTRLAIQLQLFIPTWAYLGYIFPLPALNILAARFQVPRDWNLSYNCPLRPSITP